MSDEAPATIGDDEDDPTVADDEVLYRRIHKSQAFTDEHGHLRPGSGAFEDREDGISVFLRSVLVEYGHAVPEVVVADLPNRHVAALTVRDVRALGCGVTRDPDPPGEVPHACNAAHALVHTPLGGKARSRKMWKAIAKSASMEYHAD